MIECHFDTNPSSYILIIRIAAAVSLPINLIGLYCVLTKTPTCNKDARLIMTVYQLFNTILDFTMNIFFEPVLMAPLPFGRPAGLISLFGGMSVTIGILICLCGISNTMCSFLQAFHFRLNFILPSNSFLKIHCRYKFMALRVFYYFAFDAALLAAFFWEPTNLQEQASQILNTYTCGSDLLNSPDVDMYDGAASTRMFIVVTIEGLIIIVPSVFMVGLSYYHIQKMPAISERTHTLQKEFQLSLTLQAFIPIGIVLIPGLVFHSMLFAGNMQMQTYTNVVMVIISLHGVTATIVMLLFTRNYRQFLLRLVLRKNATSPQYSSEHK